MSHKELIDKKLLKELQFIFTPSALNEVFELKNIDDRNDIFNIFDNDFKMFDHMDFEFVFRFKLTEKFNVDELVSDIEDIVIDLVAEEIITKNECLSIKKVEFQEMSLLDFINIKYGEFNEESIELITENEKYRNNSEKIGIVICNIDYIKLKGGINDVEEWGFE